MIDGGTESGGAPFDIPKRGGRKSRGGPTANLPAPHHIDRLPPHSIEAEQGVLGCILLSPNENLGTCIEKFKKGMEGFYDLRHQTIFDVLTDMYDAKEPIDLITLQQRLKDKGQLDPVGGIPYLAALSDSVPSAANLEYYLDIVREKYILRKMIQTCTSAVARVYEYRREGGWVTG